MSPIQIVTVLFGGMAVMVVTTVCGAMIGYNLYVDAPNGVNLHGDDLPPKAWAGIGEGLFGGAIGALVGAPIWVWLGYMVSRKKKPAELPPGPPSS